MKVHTPAIKTATPSIKATVSPPSNASTPNTSNEKIIKTQAGDEANILVARHVLIFVYA